MSAPVIALRRAIRNHLLADASLVAALGGSRIYDEVPRGSIPPYAAFGAATQRDWSTSSDTGDETILVLNVWTSQPGAKQGLEIAEAIRALLHDAALTLVGHRLIQLRFQKMETRAESQGRFYLASLAFRATTERL